MTPADTLRAAVEALEGMLNPIPSPPPDVPGHMWYVDQLKGRRDAADYALSLLRSALEGGEPQPVAWANEGGLERMNKARTGYTESPLLTVNAKYTDLFTIPLYLTSIPPNTPEDALRRAGAAGPLGDEEVASGVAAAHPQQCNCTECQEMATRLMREAAAAAGVAPTVPPQPPGAIFAPVQRADGTWDVWVDGAAGVAPTAQPSELHAILEFLYGAAPLDGCWFGDGCQPTGQGRYWWRSRLRAALAASGVMATGPTKEDELRQALQMANDNAAEWKRRALAAGVNGPEGAQP